MKRTHPLLRPLTAVAIALVLCAGSAAAAGYSVALSGGAGLPTSDYGDAYSTGWNLGGSGDYQFNSILGMGVDLGYDSSNAKSEYEAALAYIAETFFGAPPGMTIDDKISAFHYGVHATAAPPMVGPIHPYGQFGVAAYSLKEKLDASDPTYSGEISKTLFGVNGGVGVDFAAAPTVSMGIAGIYHWINAKNDFGSNATWFSVQGKVTFHIPIAK